MALPLPQLLTYCSYGVHLDEHDGGLIEATPAHMYVCIFLGCRAAAHPALASGSFRVYRDPIPLRPDRSGVHSGAQARGA